MIDLVLDLETAGNDRAVEYYAQKDYSAPANYGTEAAMKWVDKEKLKQQGKAALSAVTGKIICIGYCLVDDYKIIEPTVVLAGDDEGKILAEFAAVIAKHEQDTRLNLWAHNGIGFDFPFLFDRYLALDIGIPAILSQRYHLKDTMALGRSSRVAKHHSLNDDCWLMNIDGKEGNGGQVAAMYAEGNWDWLQKYCAVDVDRAAEKLRRSRPLGLNIYKG